MSEKIEQTLKKIHIYLANCKPGAYSEDDLIVSKTKIFALLEELTYASYEAMEEYEMTQASKERAMVRVKRQAEDIKKEAQHYAENFEASALLYTQEGICDVKNIMEKFYKKIRREYEDMLANYEERLQNLETDSLEVMAQLQTKADAGTYFQLVEEIKTKVQEQRLEASSFDIPEETLETKEESDSKPMDKAAVSTELAADEYEEKLASDIIVAVHSTPKVPEGFHSAKKKKKKGKQETTTELTEKEEPVFGTFRKLNLTKKKE